MTRIKQTVFVFITIVALASIAVIAPSLTRGQGQAQAGNQLPLNVNVVNNPLPVRDAENPARSAFSTVATMNLSVDVGSRVSNLMINTSQRTFVIEYVSASCETPGGQRPTIQIGYVVGGDQLQAISFPVLQYQQTVTFAFGGSRDTFHTSEPVKIYVPEGGDTQIGIEVSRSPTFGSASCRFFLSGYSLDLQ